MRMVAIRRSRGEWASWGWSAFVFFAASGLPGCRLEPAPAKPPVAAAAPAEGLEAVESAPSPASLAAGHCAPLAAEFFNSLVTLESVFADPETRQLYAHEPPEVENGLWASAFYLKPQPGMVEGRHFQIISFIFGCPGVFVVDPTAGPAMSSTGGPNGGFLSVSARTRDGRFDVRVAEGMLLPEAVHPPQFSLQKALTGLLDRYDRASTQRGSQ